MVTINNEVDQDIINQNPTPHEIKERLATLSLNGKAQRKPKEHGTQATDNSDQENQKPQNTQSSEKGRKKSKKQRISLTPSFFGGRKSESNEEHTDKIHSILGVKDYTPGNRTSMGRRNRDDEIEPTEKLFIGKLPLTLTEEELYAHFSQFGQITEAIIKEQRGFGFVTFSSIEEANRALDASHCLHGAEIEVKRAMPNRFSQKPLSSDHALEPNGHSPAQAGQWGEYAMYQAQPYAYAPPMFIPTAYPPPLIANVTPIEPVSPPQHHHENDTTTSPHETTSDKSTENNYNVENNIAQHHQLQHQHMDGDLKQQCKLFIGGLHWKTQDSDLKDYFSKMGTVTDAMVILEPNSQRSRGFGFVVFSNAEEAQNVFADKEHEINGKTVEVKRAISKDQMKLKPDSESDFHPTARNNKDDADSNKLAHVPVDKIFVGGIRKDTTKDFLIQYFQYTFDGNVTRVDMKTDGDGANRGFAFITFDSTDVVDRICASKFHRIGSHFCEVKKAHPKNADLDNNNVRRTDKVDYGGYRGNGANGGGSYDSYAAYSAFSQAQTATVPHVWYHPGYAHAHAGVAAPQTYHHGELGEYIGGTWYPKQNGSESGLPDEAASNLAPAYGIPTLVYPASYSYYPAYASPPAAYFPQQQQLSQKDI